MGSSMPIQDNPNADFNNFWDNLGISDMGSMNSIPGSIETGNVSNELVGMNNNSGESNLAGLGWAITGAGIAAGDVKMFNNESWFSVKQWKTYSQTFNGNGYTGGKIASAKNISTGFKVGGYLLGAYSAYSTNQQYQNGEISTFQMTLDQTSNAYSTFGGIYGAAWGVGWESGRVITNTNWYQQWKQDIWYPLRQNYLGY
jgi:hypothetical protein